MDCSKNQPCESLRALEQKVDGKFREYDGRLGDGEVSFAVIKTKLNLDPRHPRRDRRVPRPGPAQPDLFIRRGAVSSLPARQKTGAAFYAARFFLH